MAVNIDNKMDILVARITKVRRWLAAIALLKVAAVCMLFACGYIGAYIWLDHRLNFGGLGRIMALLLLIAGAAVIVYKLSRLLLIQISYTNAANYIENKNSFNQQLVAAMEYYEKKADYPYSEVLAEQLVARVCDDSETFRFDSTIRKWHGYILAAVVLFGVSVVGFYIQRNLAYLRTYFTRLTLPFAAVEPVSAVTLESITGDFVAEPESMLTFAAGIKGRVPETGRLVLEPQISDGNEVSAPEEIQISPVLKEGSDPKFEASKFFEEIGRYRYRFEVGPAGSEWHNVEIREAPKIESITAEVSLSAKLLNNNTLKNYTEQVRDNKLELIENSTVTLRVRTTDKLSEAAIMGLEGQSGSKQFDGADNFTYTFTANKDGSVGFLLTDEKGLVNEDVPDLEIKLKTDEPPKFKLVSPESDYLATNVASVPIEFEVTDDFGLSSIQMYLELPYQQPTELTFPLEPGVKEKKITHILELEKYNMEVGDSILFYALATDVTTGIIPEHNSSSSDTYFIEIRPYQQYWHLMPGGGEGKGPGGIPESLMTVLEYTRAIVKKTWTIASQQNLTAEDRSKLDSIADDVTYCSELLKTIRDDPELEFTDAHKAVLNQVLSQYEQAVGCLGRYDAPSALVPEKNAYRILRKFIIELELQYSPPSGGQSPPQEKPDSVKLQESPEFTGFEKERIDAEMMKLQRNIKQLKREQKQLKTDFENFLEQQKQASKQAQTEPDKKSPDQESPKQKQQKGSEGTQSEIGKEQKSQSSTDGQSSGDSSAESQEARKSQSSSGKGSSGDKESIASKDQSGSDGDRSSDEKGDAQKSQSGSGEQSGSESSAEGQQARKSQADSTSQSGRSVGSSGDSKADGRLRGKEASDGRNAVTSDDTKAVETARDADRSMRDSSNVEARLRMLQAKQRSLQEKVSQLKQELKNLPQSPDMPTARASDQAQKHLNEAIEKMEQFQDKLDEARYDTQSDNKATEAIELMDSAERDLGSAENALEPGMTMSEEQQLAKKAQEMAEQLAEDAAALDESLTSVEREEMLARLKAAERLLESMAGARWATMKKSGGQSGGGRVLTKDASRAADTAREISRQFWSIALEAKKREEQLIKEESSDVRFYELENEFFENAAKYSQRSNQK